MRERKGRKWERGEEGVGKRKENKGKDRGQTWLREERKREKKRRVGAGKETPERRKREVQIDLMP